MCDGKKDCACATGGKAALAAELIAKDWLRRVEPGETPQGHLVQLGGEGPTYELLDGFPSTKEELAELSCTAQTTLYEVGLAPSPGACAVESVPEHIRLTAMKRMLGGPYGLRNARRLIEREEALLDGAATATGKGKTAATAAPRKTAADWLRFITTELDGRRFNQAQKDRLWEIQAEAVAVAGAKTFEEAAKVSTYALREFRLSMTAEEWNAVGEGE